MWLIETEFASLLICHIFSNQCENCLTLVDRYKTAIELEFVNIDYSKLQMFTHPIARYLQTAIFQRHIRQQHR